MDAILPALRGPCLFLTECLTPAQSVRRGPKKAEGTATEGTGSMPSPRNETWGCSPLVSGDGVAQDTAVLAALQDALRLALQLTHPLA